MKKSDNNGNGVKYVTKTVLFAIEGKKYKSIQQVIQYPRYEMIVSETVTEL